MTKQQKRTNLFREARVILDEAARASRDVTADEQRRYDDLVAQGEALTDEINREDALYHAEYRAAQGERSDYVPLSHRDAGTSRTADADRGFERFLRSGETRATSGFSRLTDAEGGYLCPATVASEVLQARSEANVMVRICRNVTANGDISFPTGSALSATWVDEEGAYLVPAHNVFDEAAFSAYKAGTILPVSEELLQDSAVNVEQFIARAFGEAIGVLEEAAYVAGDGIKKPTGVIPSATVGVTSALATAIAVDEIVDLYHSVPAAYRGNGSWLMNDVTFQAIRKLKDGNDRFLIGDLSGGATPQLLGRPVFFSSNVDTIAASKVVAAFGDFTRYLIVSRPGFAIQRLNELYAATGQIGFRMWHRTDGKLTDANAIKTLVMHV